MKRGMANCKGGDTRWGGKQTSPVGSFQPNPFGLYDTAGNVWEWVQDNWHENYQGAPADGTAWEEKKSFWQSLTSGGQRVIRGGSWSLVAEFLRGSDRFWNGAVYRNDVIGFRLAQDIK